MTLFIGDVHGKYERYKGILASHPPGTIQVGDMGVGFRYTQGPWEGKFQTNPPHYAMKEKDARFIRGNHDNPAECRKHSQWISDGETDTLDKRLAMFCGGAVSIDRDFRRKDYTYWEDEELDTPQLNRIVDVYKDIKPQVMVTHDCPEEVAGEMLRVSGRYEKMDPRHSSRSRQAFQSMWSAHSPELWVFGHWHMSFDHVLRGTRFVCLAELETREL